MRSRPRVFYGWWVVAAGFAVTFTGFGAAYSFSTFIGSLQADFAASRGAVSLVFSLAGFIYFGLGIVTGPLADRWGSRRLTFLGMLLTGTGLIAASAARSLTEIYAAYGLGVGCGIGCSYVPAVGAVQRWFARRRGLASGLAVSGIGVGTLAVPPLAAALIAALGWRGAYLTLGVLALLFGGGMALLIENDPRERGLAPDGDPPDGDPRDGDPPDAAPAPPGGAAGTPLRPLLEPPGTAPARPQRATAARTRHDAPGTPLRQALRSRPFIALYAAGLICSCGTFVPFVHVVPSAVDRGVPLSAAVALLSVIGVGSTAGRFLLGGLADRLGRQRSLTVMFLGMAGALTVWAFAGDFWWLAGFAFAYGVFYGGWVAVLPTVVMDHFGGRHISGIIGALYTSVAFGTLIGPAAAGFVYDVRHSYTIPILASAAVNLVAAGILAGATRRERRAPPAAAG